MTLITRSGWGARAPKSTPQHVPINTRTATCVHHDGATPVLVRTFAEAVAQIHRDQNYHMDHNGWADIGYNYLVISAPGTSVDGLVFEGRGRDVVGAHCLNWNTPWIGVQVAVGGEQQPSAKALESVRSLHDSFVAAAGHGLAMKGHKDGFNTACPGVFLQAWVQHGMPVGDHVASLGTVSRGEVRKPVPAKPPVVGKLVVDGDFGPATVRALQRWVGAAQDGFFGPNTKRLLQRKLHVTVDGSIGPVTERALQRVVGATQDGDWGPGTTRALQVWLNAHVL